MELFLKIFSFWLWSHFFAFEPPNTNLSKMVHVILTAGLPPSLQPKKQVQETHETSRWSMQI